MLQEYDAILKLYSESINQRSSIQPGGLLMKERASANFACALYLFVDSNGHWGEMLYSICRLSHLDIY